MKIVVVVARPKAVDRNSTGHQSGRHPLLKDSVPGLSGNNGARNGNGSHGSSRGQITVLPEQGESETARKIEQSIAYMTQHLDQPLQVATLAAQANVSQSHYFALFKRRTGCAPIDYFTRLRMQYACRLLLATSSSVKEIADTLGYVDPFYFSRVFKSVNRIPPSEYRMMQKESKNGAQNRPAAPGLLLQRELLIASPARAGFLARANANVC